MFSISQVLFPNQYKLRRDTVYEWPFSFVFPEWTMIDRTTEYETGSSAPFDFLIGPHPLPPTYNMGLKHSYGYVQYSLEASVGRQHKPLTATEDLTFSPSFDPSALDDSMTRHEVTLKHATSRLAHEGRSRTFKELLRDGLSSSMGLSIPTAIFHVHISLPKVVVLGDSLPILLILYYDPESTTESTPRITIRITSLHFNTLSVIRGTHESVFGAKTDKTRATSNTLVLKSHWAHSPTTSSSEDIDIHPEIPLELRAHWPDEGIVYPDFKCFSLSNTHTLQATVTVTVATKQFIHEFPATNINVLPPRPQDENSIAAQIQAASALESLTPLVPPAGMSGHSPSSPASSHSQAPSSPWNMSRTDSDEGTSFPAEETIQTDRGLMLRYGPPTGIVTEPVLSSTSPLVPVRKLASGS